MKKDIFDLLRSLEEKSEQINSLFESHAFLDNEISMIWEMIENSYGVENTDHSTEILAEFGMGNLSKKKAQEALKKLAK